MNASLANKTFCITGAAAGIGLSTARHFLANGASVGLSDFNERALFELHSSLDESQRSRVYIQALDVANRGQVKEFLHATKKQFGRIDGIANIAGTPGKSFGVHEIWEIPTEEYDRVMDTNVRGTFNFLAESLVPGLLEEPASIVTIGSVASLRGYNRGAIYSTSKHAIIGLTKSAAMEGGSRSIRVNAVLPGPVDTEMLRSAETSFGDLKRPSANRAMQRFANVSELSDVIVFLLGPQSTFVTGAVWAVDGGSLA